MEKENNNREMKINKYPKLDEYIILRTLGEGGTSKYLFICLIA